MDNKGAVKDRALAVAKGEHALRVLDRSRESFNAAGRYGFWEMFGGGFLAGGRKSVQLTEVKNTIGKIKTAMEAFKESLDMQWISKEQWIDLCEFIQFCEIFLEQPVADWRAHSRIDDAKIQVNIARERLRKIVTDLAH